MLKIFTDSSFLTEAHRRIIFPLLFDLHYIKNEQLLKFYQFVPVMEDAEIVIVPVDINYFFTNKKSNWLYNFIDEAIKKKKIILVYSAGDFGISLKKNVYTFRMGGFNTKLDGYTYILPGYAIDPYSLLDKEFKVLEKQMIPQIGFVGNANGSIMKFIKEFLIYLKLNLKRLLKLAYSDYQPFYPSSTKRNQFLKALKKNKLISTNFIIRKKYRAGAKTNKEREKTTLDFFENIYANPYTFCLRGSGNFSIRFYETLATGRIPFLIDTDVRLPLSQNISWKNHCVIAEENDFMNTLINFHKNISEEDFMQMQINNRNLWLNCLKREKFFLHIHDIFKNKQ